MVIKKERKQPISGFKFASFQTIHGYLDCRNMDSILRFKSIIFETNEGLTNNGRSLLLFGPL